MANADYKIHSRVSGGASQHLKFPSDVGEMSKNQHYITFFINQQDNAVLKFPTATGATPTTGPTEPGSTITIERAPTTRLQGSITLYMPNQLQVTHKANYGEPEMGAFVAALQAAGKAATGSGTISANQVVDFAAETLREKVQGMAEEFGVAGARAASDIASGKVTVNRSEIMFEGIDRRSFSFNFRMLPRSQEEADQIELIVTQFRLHSMPDIMDVIGGRKMAPPSTFDIEYTPDTHLHRISTCVLESVDVQYGGDRTQFFEDGHPVQTTLALQFKEIEIITKRRVAQGF